MFSNEYVSKPQLQQAPGGEAVSHFTWKQRRSRRMRICEGRGFMVRLSLVCRCMEEKEAGTPLCLSRIRKASSTVVPAIQKRTGCIVLKPAVWNLAFTCDGTRSKNHGQDEGQAKVHKPKCRTHAAMCSTRKTSMATTSKLQSRKQVPSDWEPP